jgi:hypothetical protein
VLGLLVTPLLYLSVKPLVDRAIRTRAGAATIEHPV